MDAGFLSVVEIGQYFMTKDTGDFTQFHAVACREYTLPREDGSSQPRGSIQGNTKIGPVLEVTTSCLHGKHGVEIRIMVSERRQYSLLGLESSHGSSKFVMDSNNNDTEVLDDQPEEQALQTECEGFCMPIKRQKENHKEKNLLILHQKSFRWTKGIGLILNWGNILSLCVRSFEESNSSSLSFSASTSRRGWSGSFLENKRKSSESNSRRSIHWSDESMESMLSSRRRSEKEISVLH